MAQGFTIFEDLEKSIDDYIIEQQTKITRAKTTRDVKLLIEIRREKHHQSNYPQNIETNELNEYLYEFILSVSEKMAKNLNIQVLEVYFQVLIDIWKIANIPSVIEDVAFERKKKMQLKKESKGNRPKAAEAVSDDEINIFYEKNFLEMSKGAVLIKTLRLFNLLHFGLRVRGSDVERMPICVGETFSSWKMQMELNIYFFFWKTN